MKRKTNSLKRQGLLLLEGQLTQKLQQGLMHHQNGLIQEAKIIYAEILNRQPMHSHANHLLGLIASKEKNHQLAVDLITKAIIIYPDNAAFHSNLGLALKELKKFDAAISSFKKAISIQPDFAEAYANYGNVLQILKQFDAAIANYDKAISIQSDFAPFYFGRGNILHEMNLYPAAIASYDKAISIQPDFVTAYVKCGNALHGLKQYETAIIYYDKAISVQPDLMESHFSRGNALYELKQYEEAIVCYNKAISIQPDFAEVYSNLGNALYEFKQYETAIIYYDKAISIQADYAQAYCNRGKVLKELKQYEEAIFCYDKAIAIRPDYADAYFNRGNALYELKQYEEAIFCYDKAIAIRPDYADAYCNRSNVLKDLKEYETAITGYKKAIALKPDHAVAYYNLGTVLGELHQFEAALASFYKAIELKPDYAEVHWNLSLLHLLLGNFKNGWQGYEWRWKIEDISKTAGMRNFAQLLWLGAESLKDKTILLYAEQGLGDTIQFCRYAKLVAELGAKVILEVQRPLVKVLKNLEGVIQVFTKGDTLPSFDYQCPLMSLPLAFKTELNTIPPASKNITSDNEKNSKWQTKLGEKVKPRAGLVWSGSTLHKNDYNRSLTLSQLLQYLPSNMEYVCLQKELRDIDKALLAQHPEIQYFGDALEDFTDTAALCSLMDVVISVDTSVAHLAGTLSKQTWVLLPYSPDWRWLLDRDDNPWYPSVKLYRQERIYDWNGILEKLKGDLEKLH